MPDQRPSPATQLHRPFRSYALWLLIGVLVVASAVALDWDFASLLDADERSRALQRFGDFLSSFGTPNTDGAFLQHASHLAAQTLAVAILGTVLGVLIGYVVALCATRALVMGHEQRPSLNRPVAWMIYAIQRTMLEIARLCLDVFRGVPDFAWAILILTIPGPGPVTGVLAIGISVAGIVGKIYSEQWDAVDPKQYAALRSAGASRLSVFLYGIQPHAFRSMLSYTMMRAECAIRNASVIGAVGGGGLGAEMFDQFNYGNHSSVVTLLIFMLVLTGGTDLIANLVRSHVRSDPNHPRVARGLSVRATTVRRGLAIIGVVTLIYGCWAYLRHPFLLPADQRTDAIARAIKECAVIEWEWIGEQCRAMLSPDLSAATIGEALRGSVIPIGIAVIGTFIGASVALVMAYFASVGFQIDASRFTGERISVGGRLGRVLTVVFTRLAALIARAVPEVAWVWILAMFFGLGIVPGVLAIAIHSVGVLCRVFTESIDNTPYRRFEQCCTGSRAGTFLYVGLPTSSRDLMTYALFQFEVNMRAGLVLGIIGIGGLGDSFHTSFTHWNLQRASTFVLMMIVLTVVVDRLSRVRMGRG